MSVTACTSYNTTVVVGYVPGTGNTVGDIVTFDTNNPIWMGNQRGLAPQPGAIELGGFNGLNS